MTKRKQKKNVPQELNPEQPAVTVDPGTMPRAALFAMIFVGVLIGLALAIGLKTAIVFALLTALTEFGLALVVAVAAGGYGWAVAGRRMSEVIPLGLRVATAVGLGFWLLSTAVLVIGSTLGLLTGWFWWPLIAIGLALAAWQGRRSFEQLSLPARFDGRAMAWVVIGVAAGLWLAGATRPPGYLNNPDTYDVLEYHLQVPREYYNAGRIGELEHNVYSYFPLGTEMLYLLGMCLRGGAYRGMYLAKMLHGVFAAMSVFALFTSLRKSEESRGRFAAILLGTTPIILYLGWLAMVELTEVFYLTLAVLWVREWFRDARTESAVWAGAALGAACAMKYLSVALVAGPVLLAMLVTPLLARGKRAMLAHVPLTVLAAGLLFSPWLIRNAALTGNPVFPLMTETFGRGHWSEQSQQRWIAGHAPGDHPPVPEPEGWEGQPAPSRLAMLYDHFIAAPEFGAARSRMLALPAFSVLLAIVAVCVYIAAPTRAGPWDAALVIVLATQVIAWAAFTRGMPSRFLAPAAVPLALLGAGMLAQLVRVRNNPFRKKKDDEETEGVWGRPAAVAVLLALVLPNFIVAAGMYGVYTRAVEPVHGIPGEFIAEKRPVVRDASQLPEGSRLMLIGDAQGFYYPPGTIYATAFDEHPLAAMVREGLSAEQILHRLRQMGVTHIMVDWSETLRLMNSYGFPPQLSRGLSQRASAGEPPKLDVLQRLKQAGMEQVADLWTIPQLGWPAVTLYALPWADPMPQGYEPSTPPTQPEEAQPATQPTTSPSEP